MADIAVTVIVQVFVLIIMYAVTRNLLKWQNCLILFVASAKCCQMYFTTQYQAICGWGGRD